MSDHAKPTGKQSPRSTSKSHHTHSNHAPQNHLDSVHASLGNQAMLRLLREESTNSTPSIQRDLHEHGCGCPNCARIQRQRDDKKLQRMLIQREGGGTPAPSIPFSELMALWRGREKKDVKPVPVPSVHAPVVIPAGPATATEVRAKVSSASPGSGGAVALLAARVQELRGLNLSSEVPTQADLIPVLAEDMERKDMALPVDERQNLSKPEWIAAAKSQIEGNNTTALTTSDDRYTAITGGVAFDELHEFIHICSGPGGESPLMAFKLQANEGAINVFSELVAPAVGNDVVIRYTNETPIMRKLVALIGAEGIGKLFDATFKGDIDGFFNAVGAAYVALGDKKPDGKTKSGFEKGWDAPAAAAEFKKQVGNWSLGWLNQRLP